jgi:hypothetical protein
MQTTAVWEDDDNNRKVLLRVDYEIESTGITLVDTTPVEVEFPLQNRSIRIWTQTAREMLLRQFRASSDIDSIIKQLEEQLAVSAA